MDVGIVTGVTQKIGKSVSKNSPTILAAAATVGVVFTAIEAVKGYIKAQKIIQEHEMDSELLVEGEAIYDEDGINELHPCYYRARTKWEIVKLTWTCYLIAIIIGCSTIAAIVGSNTINLKRNLALATAYSLSEEAYKEFRNKVTETLGERKVKKIDHEINQDRINNSSPQTNIPIIGYGSSAMELFRDRWSGQEFYSWRTYLELMESRMNTYIRANDSACINEWYEIIGLCDGEFGVPDSGQYFGWSYLPGPNAEDPFKIKWDHCWARDGVTGEHIIDFDCELLPMRFV